MWPNNSFGAQKPGVRLIGDGDIPLRIIAIVVLHVIGNDIQMSAGALQACVGHDNGSKAAIHAMWAIFEDNNIYAALLVDAINAFNLVNHQAALHSISILCPSFSTILRNTYGAPIRLYHW